MVRGRRVCALTEGAVCPAADLEHETPPFIGIGGEPISADTVDRFVDAFAPSGLSPEVPSGCYGLAEPVAGGLSGPTPEFEALFAERATLVAFMKRVDEATR